MTIYLWMLPLSLERDDTIWRRVDDSWYSFPFAWSFPCLASLASWAVHELLISYIAPFFLILLSCHLFALWSLTFCWAFCLTHCFMPRILIFASINDFLLARTFGSIDLLVHFLWVSALVVDRVLWHSSSSSLFHGVLPSMLNELCHLCAKLLEFIMCLASSLIWIHLVAYSNWIESFLLGLV